MDTIQALNSLKNALQAKCPEAKITEERAEGSGGAYDVTLVAQVPKGWRESQVTALKDWARRQAYEILLKHGIDIRVEVYNLTRQEQELVKWLFLSYPEVSVETLPESGIPYDAGTASELLEEHLGQVNERLIDMSSRTKADKDYMIRQHGEPTRKAS